MRGSLGSTLLPFIICDVYSIMGLVFVIIKAGLVTSKDILLLSLFYSGLSPRENQVPHSKVIVLSSAAQPDTCFTT